MQDNPDVDGNQKKIKEDKYDLINYMEQLNAELRELSFSQFRGDIRAGLDAQGEFDRLRFEEKDLNTEIKNLNEKYKREQDDFAKEANEVGFVGGGFFDVGERYRPHPTSPKGRRKIWIINKILFWGVMIAAFAFAVAFADSAVNRFVRVAIQI